MREEEGEEQSLEPAEETIQVVGEGGEVLHVVKQGQADGGQDGEARDHAHKISI